RLDCHHAPERSTRTREGKRDVSLVGADIPADCALAAECDQASEPHLLEAAADVPAAAARGAPAQAAVGPATHAQRCAADERRGRTPDPGGGPHLSSLRRLAGSLLSGALVHFRFGGTPSGRPPAVTWTTWPPSSCSDSTLTTSCTCAPPRLITTRGDRMCQRVTAHDPSGSRPSSVRPVYSPGGPGTSRFTKVYSMNFSSASARPSQSTPRISGC